MMRSFTVVACMALMACVVWAVEDRPVLSAGGPAQEAPAAGPASQERSWLGVWLADAVDGGVQIVALVPRGPAATAGLERGDIILEANGLPVSDEEALGGLLERLSPGETIKLSILRSGEPIDLPVELGDWTFRFALRSARPPSAPASAAKADIRSVHRLESLLGGGPLGLEVAEITPVLRKHYGAPEDAGLLVVRIEAGKPAEEAGFEVGDVLVRIDGHRVADREQLEERLLACKREGRMEIQVVRGSEPRALSLTAYRSSEQSAMELVDQDLTLSSPVLPGEASDVRRRLKEEIESLERRVRELRRILEELEGRPRPATDD